MTQVLLLEDDERLRTSLTVTLREEGFGVQAVGAAEGALQAILGAERVLPLLLLDVRLGDGPSGVDVVRRLAQAGRLPPTVMISGAATISETVEALRLGVFDFIEKPFGKERLMRSLRNALEQASLRQRVADLEQQLGAPELLGSSPAMAALRERALRLAGTEARVLVLGESGTGKELVAETLHLQSPRRDRPFVKLNCAALPGSLVEAELFGHARGAFTDARSARHGLFEEADGGTLLLDEIGDMDLALQARLLRVLEDGSVRRIGETQERRVDVRVVAATHCDLEQAVAAGRFRRDLYFRLAHVPLQVPALRDHLEDVPELFRHFIGLFSARHRLRSKEVREEVFAALQAYAWPGNVRELRNLCERLVLLGSDPLSVQDLPADVLRGTAADETGWLRPARLLEECGVVSFRRFKAECEREYLEAVLQRTRWNFSAAARALGLHRTHLHAKAVEMGLARPGQGSEGAAS